MRHGFGALGVPPELRHHESWSPRSSDQRHTGSMARDTLVHTILGACSLVRPLPRRLVRRADRDAELFVTDRLSAAT